MAHGFQSSFSNKNQTSVGFNSRTNFAHFESEIFACFSLENSLSQVKLDLLTLIIKRRYTL